MKILYIVSTSCEIDGASKSFLNMINGVRAQGNRIAVVFPDSKGLYQILKKRGILVYCYKYEFSVIPKLKSIRDYTLFFPRLIRMYLKNNRATKKLKRLAHDFRPDIIHTNVSPISIGYRVASDLKIPHVYHVREYGDKDFDLNIINIKEKLKKSFTISITKDIANYRGLKDPGKDTVVYNGVLSESDIRYCSKKKPYFLYAGRLTEKKGFKLLMDAYIEYVSTSKHPFDLYVAGEAPDKVSVKLVDSIKSILAEREISNRVKWLGVVSNVNDLMFETAATIVPSYNEGFGRVVAEGMFNGSLIIGYDNGGIKEQLDNGVVITGEEIGLRFKSKNELVRHLINVEKDVIDVSSYVIRSTSCIQKLYTTEKNIENILNFYSRICDNNELDS